MISLKHIPESCPLGALRDDLLEPATLDQVRQRYARIISPGLSLRGASLMADSELASRPVRVHFLFGETENLEQVDLELTDLPFKQTHLAFMGEWAAICGAVIAAFGPTTTSAIEQTEDGKVYRANWAGPGISHAAWGYYGYDGSKIIVSIGVDHDRPSIVEMPR